MTARRWRLAGAKRRRQANARHARREVARYRKLANIKCRRLTNLVGVKWQKLAITRYFKLANAIKQLVSLEIIINQKYIIYNLLSSDFKTRVCFWQCKMTSWLSSNSKWGLSASRGRDCFRQRNITSWSSLKLEFN